MFDTNDKMTLSSAVSFGGGGGGGGAPDRSRGITNNGPTPASAYGTSQTGISNGAHQASQNISIDANGNGTSVDEAALGIGLAATGVGLAATGVVAGVAAVVSVDAGIVGYGASGQK